MNLLGFDTATEALSVVARAGDRVVSRHARAERRHAEWLLPWCAELLAEAGLAASELDALVVGRGPGAFTGVRVGVAAGQGMAHGLGRPVLPVSSLELLAFGAWRRGRRGPLWVLIDARMGECYAQAFVLDDEHARPTSAELLIAPADLKPDLDATLVGTGAGYYKDHWPAAQLDAEALPDIADVINLAAERLNAGQGVDAAKLSPVYLRDRVAEPSVAR